MGQRLLIVDGDRRFIKDHQAALEAAFDVDYLHSTDGVIPLLETGDFAAALICVEVSENKGYALCSAIRKHARLTDLKVALISAKATEEEYARHRSLKGKADLYLHKPLVSSALVASLAPLAPPRSVDPDNPLGDLSGADLGDEWLESLKAELETDDKPAPPAPARAPAAPKPAVPSHSAPTSASIAIPLPAALQKIPQVSPDAGKVELLESRVRDLESKLQAQADELVSKDRELEDLRSQHDAVTRNLDDLEQRQRDAGLVQQKLADAEGRIQQLESENARHGESAESTRRAAEEAEADRHRLQGLVEDLGRQLSDKERETADLRQTAEERNGSLQALQDQIDQLRSESEGLRAGAAHEEELKGRNQELEGRIQELQAQVGRLEEFERRAGELQSRCQELEGRLQEQDGRIADLQGRANAVSELEQQLLESRENYSRQEAGVVEMQAQRDAKAQELIEKNQEIESLKVDVAGLEATLRGQRRELADQGSRLGSLTRECESMQAKLTQQEERIQELARVLSEKMQILAEREHELSESRAAVERLEASLASKEKAFEEREHHIAQLRNTKDQLEIHCEELEQDMAKLVSQHEKQQLELMKGVDEREAQIARLNESLAGSKDRSDALEREKQALEGSLNERSARLEALTGAITDLENSIRRASDLTRPF